MAQFPLLPLLNPLCLPFVFPSTYLAPSSCDRNRPPPSQVACKLTLFAPPFTQLSHPLQIPRTPTAQRLTMTTSGIFRLLLSGTIMSAYLYDVRMPELFVSACIMSAQLYNACLPVWCLPNCTYYVRLPIPKVSGYCPIRCLPNCMISGYL